MQEHSCATNRGKRGFALLMKFAWTVTACAGLGCVAEPATQAVRHDSAVRDANDEPSASGTGGMAGAGGAQGTGGVQGTGGDTQGREGGRQDALGNGGASGTGGATGTGGSSSGGGATSTGGSVGSGGASNKGGVTGRGGSSNTGGSVGSGGASGKGGTLSSSPDGAADALGTSDVGIVVVPIPDAAVKNDAPAAFWTTTYAANCAPAAIGGRNESDGHHRPGEDCMRSGCHLKPKSAHHHAGTDCRGSGCHSNGSPDGSGAPAFLFGGTVYRAVTMAADPKVEVAVKATEGMYLACSANNGNFWIVAPSNTKTLTWSGAGVRLRNANGEAPMMTTAAAGCNASACHTGVMKITSP
jgi:hypothetical protein